MSVSYPIPRSLMRHKPQGHTILDQAGPADTQVEACERDCGQAIQHQVVRRDPALRRTPAPLTTCVKKHCPFEDTLPPGRFVNNHHQRGAHRLLTKVTASSCARMNQAAFPSRLTFVTSSSGRLGSSGIGLLPCGFKDSGASLLGDMAARV